ncbi:hypothetical protein RHECNPAF_770067 [Rhizobium etli CNPAF512]|nr:hypothetical protein RHECNPAF_770067 [Rhizobium etli CNPAF512]
MVLKKLEKENGAGNPKADEPGSRDRRGSRARKKAGRRSRRPCLPAQASAFV